MQVHPILRLFQISLVAFAVDVRAASVEAPSATLVTVESGALRGTLVDGVIAFKGIPFAAPPVGALRWRAPQPAAHWDKVRDAADYGHDCMQLPFPSDAAPLGTPPSEDCLYANVWRPATAQTGLPVLVWIYGGGFVNGGSSPPTYSGAELAKQGILFFSFNYRLGRFGTFGHPQLSAGNADGGELGNFNVMDQIAALRWVQRNIAAFGGDPAKVTIVGESAGGRSIHTLLTSPQTSGLFERAVIQSGADGGTVEASAALASLDALGVDFARTKGIAADDPQALSKLRALSSEQIVDGLNLSAILAAILTKGPPPETLRTLGGTTPDGKVVVDSLAAYRSGAFRHVPIMVGSTSDDLGGETGFMAEGALTFSRLVTKMGIPAYYYRFSYVAESARTPTTKGAAHASDIPFFFHTEAVKYGSATTELDRAAGKMASAYLVNFVKTGNPNSPGLPQWPQHEPATDSLMDFTLQGKAVPGPDPKRHALDAAAAVPAPTR